MAASTDPSEKQSLVRVLAFLLAIVPTSITVSFAAFVGNEYLLFVALLPCVITLAFSIIPTPLPPTALLVCGAISFLTSVSVIVFAVVVHMDKIKYYVPLPFD